MHNYNEKFICDVTVKGPIVPASHMDYPNDEHEAVHVG